MQMTIARDACEQRSLIAESFVVYHYACERTCPLGIHCNDHRQARSFGHWKIYNVQVS